MIWDFSAWKIAWSLFTPSGQYPPLSHEQLLLVGGVCTAIFGIVALISYNVFKKDQKKMAWCISLFNSFVSTCFGCYYLGVNLKRHDNFFGFGPDPNVIFYSVAPIENIACIWFSVACVVDIISGVICYPKYLDLLTGRVHQIVYIWMMYFSCTGNGVFVKDKPFASAFVHAHEELQLFFSTRVSSTQMRVNKRFGLSFFILRIVYHTYIVIGHISVDFTFPGCVCTILLIFVWKLDVWMGETAIETTIKSVIGDNREEVLTITSQRDDLFTLRSALWLCTLRSALCALHSALCTLHYK